MSNFVSLELQKLELWLRANKLAVNNDKIIKNVFHPKCKILSELPLQPAGFIYPIQRILNLSKIPAQGLKYSVFSSIKIKLLNITSNMLILKLTKSSEFFENVNNIISNKASLLFAYSSSCLPYGIYKLWSTIFLRRY